MFDIKTFTADSVSITKSKLTVTQNTCSKSSVLAHYRASILQIETEKRKKVIYSKKLKPG